MKSTAWSSPKTWSLFLIGFLLSVCFAVYLILQLGKGASFIFLNQWHATTLDHFFEIYTNVGDGFFALALVAIIFIFFRDKYKHLGVAILLSFLISGLFAQLLKHFFPSPRPQIFFKPGAYHHFIEGVSLMGNSSFPSGHTATAFGLATVFSVILKKKWIQLFVLIAALGVAYSRMYLGQHFLQDVLAGAMIGFISGLLSVELADNIYFGKWKKKGADREANDQTNSPSPKSNLSA